MFLNGCETVELGQLLVDEHVPIVICTLRSISDVMARETSQLFYKAFAQTGDARAAYNMSKPPVKGGYSILTNGLNDQSLAPILERLAAFTTFMSRNDVEHKAILDTIADTDTKTERMTRIMLKSRVWNIVIMLCGMVGVGVIVGLMGMLGRGAIP